MKSSKIILAIFLLCSYGNAEVLTILDAYNLALQNSKELKSSEYQIEANKEEINQAKAQLYPQIYLSASYAKKKYDGSESGRLSNYTLSFNESLYDSYKINRVDVAKSKVRLDNFKIEFQKQELAQRVFKLYMNILKSQSKIEVYNAYITAKEKRVEFLNKKLQLSLGTKTDLLQGEVDYHSSTIDLLREKKFIRVNKLRLKHLIGVNSIELPYINLDNITDDIVNRMSDIVEMGKSNFDSNLKLAQSKMSVDLSQKEIISAKSAHYPTLSINAQYSKINADRQVSGLENARTLMVQIQLPLYQGGATESKVTASKLSYSSAKENQLQVEDDIREEYAENLATFESSAKSISLYRESLNSARAYLDSIQQSVNAGLKSSLDLNEAKSKLYEVKYRFVQNIYDMINAYIDLLVVTNQFDNLGLVDEIIVSPST